MPDLQNCPHCAVDLRDPAHGGYWRTIGVEIQGVYDGVPFWLCPDCHGSWHRWPEGSPYRARAERHIWPRSKADADV